MRELYDPPGLEFYDAATKRTMKLVYEGTPYAGWLFWRHPDGQWVTLRKATDEDVAAISSAVSRAHHEEPLDGARRIRGKR